LFFQQAIGLQTRELPEHNRELKHQVLMLLDEFSALGHIPIMAEAISYLPGYNVRVLLVIQTPSQLREVYGQNAAEAMVKTLAPPPVLPPIDIAAVPRGERERFGNDNEVSRTGLDPIIEVSVRPVEASDVARLDELDLEDFSVNFDDVVIPQGRALTDHEIQS